MLSCRTSSEEHTYMNLTVNVAVCENWVFSNKFMKKALEYDVYAPPAGKPCGSPVSVKNLCETSFTENL